MLKRLTYIAAFIAALILASSCANETARLARDLQGSWSGAPERMTGGPAAETTLIETIDFMGSDSVSGGNIIVNAMISMTGAVSGSDAIVEPVSLTAAASATISGVWRAIDDDEVSVTLDPRTLDVNVDPKTVLLSTNVLTGAEAPALDSITPGVTAMIKSRIASSLQMKYLAMKYLDDVKIKDNILRFEVGGVDYTFQRQGIALK